MQTDNPFNERPPHKKIVVAVSLTRPQREAFDWVQAQRGCESQSALIKLLLREEFDRLQEAK